MVGASGVAGTKVGAASAGVAAAGVATADAVSGGGGEPWSRLSPACPNSAVGSALPDLVAVVLSPDRRS